MKSKKMRDSARGEQCTLQIVGVCNHDNEKTVLAHLPHESNGMGKKTDDISSCYACSSCHDVIDGRASWPLEEKKYDEWYMRRAMVRTWLRMIEKGVMLVK